MTEKNELEECCGNCRFFHQGQTDPTALTKVTMCRRFPPSSHLLPQGHGIGNIGAYPPVQETHWCGEWERKALVH